jgi:hypothetical protein
MYAESVTLVPVELPEQREAARTLLLEYLQWIADIALSTYGLSFDIDAMVRSDIEDCSKFYPPTGAFTSSNATVSTSVWDASSVWRPMLRRFRGCTYNPTYEALAPAAR